MNKIIYRSIKIKNMNSGVLTVAPSGSQKVEGANSIELETQGAAVTLWSNGMDWYVF